MRTALGLLFVLGCAFGTRGAQAESKAALPSDATLSLLIEQSLAARPELARARAIVRANQERVPQANALPDPMLEIGIQNDGFKSIEIGTMETSYLSFMAKQTFPWPGKRRMQGEIAETGVSQAKAAIARAELSLEAEVRKTYLDLLLARDRLELLARLEVLWQNAQAQTRTLYQTGGGSQSDIMRADLELLRLRRRRLALETEDRTRVQALNRLRNHPLDEPIQTTSHLQDLGSPEKWRATFQQDKAVARSPELAAARDSITRYQRASELAHRGYYPDFTVGAAYMYRGSLPPMWQVTLAGPIPIFGGSKQSRAEAESTELASAARSETEALTQAIRFRSKERQTVFAYALENLGIYEQGLLVQSQATAESTLVQYRAGKVTFASVLEANAGYLADQEGYLQSLAEAHRILIAEAEISLDPTPLGSAGSSGSGMPGAGSASSMPASSSSASSAGEAAAPSGSAGGM
ncbi:MAG TPA: TolC family protein [Polyangiaceae bacterium]|nr:TolC family protein [Polyangiaceae bacterium]